MDGDRLEPTDFVGHIAACEVRFTRSARRHRLGRSRVLAALRAPQLILAMAHRDEWAERRTLVIGTDDRGSVLEIVVVMADEGRTALVIHAMHARTRYRRLM